MTFFLDPAARLAIYAEGEFGKGHSKTAEGVIRYGRNPIAAVIDSSEAGKTVKQAVKIDCPAPIVASVKDSLQFKPDALLLGTAWTGGHLPDAWRKDILTAIENGMDVVNGLHDFLSDDPEIAQAAARHRRHLFDVRKPPDNLPVGEGLARNLEQMVVLTVGTDCSVGKMTASLELDREARRRGLRSKFVATGQTGIMICGEGIAIDRVIGDFMAGAVEQMVMSAAQTSDLIFVEGQGSLAHPGFSGVTLALLHGACPKTMILCHKASKTNICELPLPMPSLSSIIEACQSMSRFLVPAKVVGVALNTWGMDERAAELAIAAAKEETKLPVVDPVRNGAGELLDAILAHRELPVG
ncbi:MAG TPA: DUF1611 domain-containing protein [Candidatus Obscuribacterales bacterium]